MIDKLCHIEQGLGVCHVAEVKPWSQTVEQRPRSRFPPSSAPSSSSQQSGRSSSAPSRALPKQFAPSTMQPRLASAADDVWDPSIDEAIACWMTQPKRLHGAEASTRLSKSSLRQHRSSCGRLPQQLLDVRLNLKKLASCCDSMQATTASVRGCSSASPPSPDLASIQADHLEVIQQAKRLLEGVGLDPGPGLGASKRQAPASLVSQSAPMRNWNQEEPAASKARSTFSEAPSDSRMLFSDEIREILR